MAKPTILQKKKLAAILKKTGGMSDVDYEVFNGVLDEIEIVEKKIPQKVDLEPLSKSVEKLFGHISSHTAAISNISDEISSLKKQIKDDSEIKGKDKKYITGKIEELNEELKKEVEDLKKNYVSLLSKSRGGAMSRQLSINGSVIATRYKDLNLIGSGVTFSAANNDTTKQTDLTVTVASSGSGYQKPSGIVNGTNQVFVFTTPPSVICVDNQNTMNKVNYDGVTNNWTGTTTVTMAVAPNFNIFGVA